MTSLTEALKGIFKQIRRYNDAKEQRPKIPKHERYGNRSERIGVWVNGILAVITLGAIYLAYQSNQTSIKSLKYAQQKDSLNNIQQAKKEIIDSAERVANRQYVDSTLSISNQGVYAADKSSKIAENAFNETKRSYEFSRDAAITELRPYVVFNSIDLKEIRVDSILSVRVNFLNVGKTPAYKMKIIASVVFYDKEIEQKIKQFITKLEQDMDTATITNLGGNNQPTQIDVFSGSFLKKADIYRIENGIVQLFVVTCITYYDAFEVKYFTHGLVVYRPARKVFQPYKMYNDSN